MYFRNARREVAPKTLLNQVHAEQTSQGGKTGIQTIQTMSKRQSVLPSLAAFEDKRVTTGLRFVIGGAYKKTEGGHMSEEAGSLDYVADAMNEATGVGIYGLCRNHATSTEFYNSDEFNKWVREFGN